MTDSKIKLVLTREELARGIDPLWFGVINRQIERELLIDWWGLQSLILTCGVESIQYMYDRADELIAQYAEKDESNLRMGSEDDDDDL